MNASVKITLSKSEPFTFTRVSLPCALSSRSYLSVVVVPPCFLCWLYLLHRIFRHSNLARLRSQRFLWRISCHQTLQQGWWSVSSSRHHPGIYEKCWQSPSHWICTKNGDINGEHWNSISAYHSLSCCFTSPALVLSLAPSFIGEHLYFCWPTCPESVKYVPTPCML